MKKSALCFPSLLSCICFTAIAKPTKTGPNVITARRVKSSPPNTYVVRQSAGQGQGCPTPPTGGRPSQPNHPNCTSTQASTNMSDEVVQNWIPTFTNQNQVIF